MGLISDTRGRFSLGGGIALRIIVLLGGIIILNLAALHAEFHWDMTEGQTHSLAESTQQLLDNLGEPVKVLVFTAGRRPGSAERLLRRFEGATNLISFEFPDVNEQPELAQRYRVETGGVTIIEKEGQRRRLGRLNEQALAGAILQLVKGGGKKIVFSDGHGERDVLGHDPGGLVKAWGLLADAGYETVQAELTAEALKDATVLVIAAPKEEISADEASIVQRFVEGGGGLMVMVDPPPSAGLGALLSPYGIEPQDDYVVELNKAFRYSGFSASTIYVPVFRSEHPVVTRTTQPILLSKVRSLAQSPPGDEEEDIFALCVSSNNSWGETSGGEREVAWDKGIDPPGPRILVAATGEPPSVAGNGRVMAVGTAEFASNRGIDIVGNMEFWEAAVSWLAGDLDYPLVSQRGPQKKLELSDAQLRTILVVCVLVLPAISGAAGIFIFIKRAE